ncbi:MAG: hypothetical protein ACIALR_00845 [Blastopirellula sp. JB062]
MSCYAGGVPFPYKKKRPIRRKVGALLLVGFLTATTFATTDDTPATSRVISHGPVTATMTLEKRQAQIAEPLTATLTVDAPAGVLITLPQNQMKLGAFNVLSSSDAADLPTSEGRQWIRRYQLESLTPGEQIVPSISIAYSDQRSGAPTSDVAQSPELKVMITSVLEGSPDPLKFRDIHGVVELAVADAPSEAWLYWSLGGGICLAAAGAALLLWPVRNKRLSAKAQALAQLAQLQSSDLLQAGQTELFYVRLTNILRQYVERELNIAAPRLTTDEFLEQAVSSDSLNDQLRAMLRSFLTQADLVKFARLEPGRDVADQAIERARQFIQTSAAALPNDHPSTAEKENA